MNNQRMLKDRCSNPSLRFEISVQTASRGGKTVEVAENTLLSEEMLAFNSL
jgi:hypothetical protein